MKKLLAKFGITDVSSFWAFAKQFLKFGIVGISNTLLSLTIYYILVYFCVNYLLANVIAFVVSVLNAYYWNSRFVFKQNKENKIKRLVKVYISYGVTFLIGQGLLYLMVNLIGISKFVAPVINLVVTIPLNFILNKFWAFR